MEILEQYKEGDYLITKYRNGAIIKQIVSENIKQEHILSEQELKQLELEEKI